MVATIGDAANFYKIGMELAYGGGLALAPKLAATGKRVFVDLKLHDIPNTVERATAQIAKLGATFLTVHAYPQTMRAAVAGARGTRPQAARRQRADLERRCRPRRGGLRLASRRWSSGARGRRCRGDRRAGLQSRPRRPRSALRSATRCCLVTPGVRPAGAAAGDQKRVATPAAAIADGADYLVVGRPITQDRDPRAAAERIVAEIASAARADNDRAR